MNETILKIKTVCDLTGAQQASSALGKLQKAFAGMGSQTKHTNTIFSNFLGSLTRIAKLRMLRGIIRTITSAFKEGTENIYRYSQAMGSADASHFASTMDALASSFLYMKNSIGAVVAPLLTALLPAIQTVVNWFVTATQVIAQFFSALNGSAFYTRAKQQATEWKAIDNAVGGASASAKEYKNTILSFDEIHALNDVPQGGGGGGGGGANPLDYSNMFEEAPINEKIKKITDFLKENWKDILDIVKAIGITMLGWKIAKGVTNFFEAMGFENGMMARRALLGMTLMVTGFTLEWKGAYDIGYNGADFGNVIKTAIGSALGIAGSALFFSAVGVGAGAGLVIGVVASLLIALEGMRIGRTQKYLDDTVRVTDNYKELTKIIEHATDVEGTFLSRVREIRQQVENLNSATYDYGKTADLAYGSALLERIKELAGKTELTADETTELQTKVEILNGLGLDGIYLEFADLHTITEEEWQALQNNIDKMLELAKTEAQFDLLKEAYKEQFRLESEHKRLLGESEVATQAKKDAEAEYMEMVEESGGFLSAYDEKTQAMAESVNHATEAETKAKKALDESDQAMKENQATIDFLTGKYDTFNGEVNETKKEILDLNKKLDALNGMSISNFIKTGLDAIRDSAYWANWELKGVTEKILELTKSSFSGISIGIYSAIGRANGGFVNGYANGGIIPRFDGGGINSADLFLANENGSAELVGRIGNRTAVANQQQMVDVLTNGVLHALSNSQGGQTSNLEVNVMMDRQVLARAVDKGNRTLNRRYNVSLA